MDNLSISENALNTQILEHLEEISSSPFYISWFKQKNRLLGESVEMPSSSVLEEVVAV